MNFFGSLSAEHSSHAQFIHNKINLLIHYKHIGSLMREGLSAPLNLIERYQHAITRDVTDKAKWCQSCGMDAIKQSCLKNDEWNKTIENSRQGSLNSTKWISLIVWSKYNLFWFIETISLLANLKQNTFLKQDIPWKYNAL